VSPAVGEDAADADHEDGSEFLGESVLRVHEKVISSGSSMERAGYRSYMRNSRFFIAA
jgi:hypothetical protein